MSLIIENQEEKMQKAKRVMFDLKSELSVKARFIYIALMMVEKDRVLKYKDIGEITDIKSDITIARAIDELRKHNLIKVNRRAYGAIYEVL